MKLFSRTSEEQEYQLVRKIDVPETAVALIHSFMEKDGVVYLKFERTKTDFVELVLASSRDVYIFCKSGRAIFETRISGDLGKQQFPPEDFVRSFCANTHKDEFNFEEEVEEEDRTIEKPQLTSHSHFGLKIWWPLILLAALTSVAVLIDDKPENNSLEALGLVFIVSSVFTLPYFILVIQYFFFNGNSTLMISRKENLLTISRGGNTNSIRIDKITKVRLTYKTAGRSFYPGFNHIVIEAGPRERAVITHFLYNDLYALVKLLKVKAKEIPSAYPLIWLRKKSESDVDDEAQDYKRKLGEFLSKWTDKSKEDLELIANSKDEYADYAVDAAKQLLKSKK